MLHLPVGEKGWQGEQADVGQLAGQINDQPVGAIIEVQRQPADPVFLQQGSQIATALYQRTVCQAVCVIYDDNLVVVIKTIKPRKNSRHYLPHGAVAVLWPGCQCAHHKMKAQPATFFSR